MSGRVAVEAHPLLGNRNFAFFWFSQAISGFGDQLTIIALAAMVWQLTRSGLYTALVVIVGTIPHAVFGFFAGPITDTVGRKRTLIACDLVRAVAVGAIPIAIALDLPLASIFLLVLIATLASALFMPTRLAVLPDLVPDGAIARGNSFVQLSDRTVEIAGKVVAGVLYVLLGPIVFLVDALSFLLSAALLSRIELAEPRPGAISVHRVLADAGTGLRVIGESGTLSANLFFSLLAQMSLAVANTLTPVYLFREFQANADAFGIAEAALAAGVVVCGGVVPLLMQRVRKGRLVVAGFALYGAMLVALAVAPKLEFAFAVFFLMGVANAIFLIPNITIYQEHTPAEFRGRVFSSRYALLNLVWLPVMVVSGALVERTSAATLIGIAGAFTLVVALAGSFVRDVRDVR